MIIENYTHYDSKYFLSKGYKSGELHLEYNEGSNCTPIHTEPEETYEGIPGTKFPWDIKDKHIVTSIYDAKWN